MPCLATTRQGQPCHFDVAPNTSFCLNHREGADTTAAASRAAQARREPSINLLETALGLYDRPSIQAALDSVLRLTLSGAITPERARVAIRACSAAARNFDTTDNLSGRKTADHEPIDYYTKVRAVLSSIDPLLQKANAAEFMKADRGQDGATHQSWHPPPQRAKRAINAKSNALSPERRPIRS